MNPILAPILLTAPILITWLTLRGMHRDSSPEALARAVGVMRRPCTCGRMVIPAGADMVWVRDDRLHTTRHTPAGCETLEAAC